MIRSLKPGEALPEGPPRRHLSSAGYVRLRWRVGPSSYVEVYEHRVQGDRVTTAEHVHHRNHNRADNRPENLLYTTADGHRAQHASVLPLICTDLYLSGWNTVEIAEDFGLNPGTVSRALAKAGVPVRPANFARAISIDADRLREMYDAGLDASRMAAEFGVSRWVIRGRMAELAFPPRGRGWRPRIGRSA